LSKSSSTN